MPYRNILLIDDDKDDQEIFFSALELTTAAAGFRALGSARKMRGGYSIFSSGCMAAKSMPAPVSAWPCVKRSCKTTNGDIYALSAKGSGTTFHIILPQEQPDNGQAG